MNATQTYTMTEAEDVLKKIISDDSLNTIMLRGPLGSGKVTALCNAAQQMDYDVCKVDLIDYDIALLYNSITHAEQCNGNTVMVIENITLLTPVLQMQLLKRILLESTSSKITYVFVVDGSHDDVKQNFSNFFLNRMVHVNVEN